MVKGLYTAYTGMVNEQRRMDVMTNNLANSATTGYKKEAMVAQAFDERLAIKIKDTSALHNMPENIWITDTTFRDGQELRLVRLTRIGIREHSKSLIRILIWL